MSYTAALASLPPRYRDVHRAMHLDNWVRYVSENASTFTAASGRDDITAVLDSTLRKHLDRLIAHERADAQPQATRRHVYVAIVTLGIALTLEEVLPEQAAQLADVREHVLGHFRLLVAPLFEMTRRRLAKAGDEGEALAMFVRWAKDGTDNLYGPPGFEVETVCVDERKGYAFDIKKCMYWEVLKRHGRTELGPVLCDYDHILFDVLKEFVSFGRRGTLARGGDCCDFRCAGAGVDPLALDW